MHRFLPICFALIPLTITAQTLRIALLGQSLIHEDLRQSHPLAIQQAKTYLQDTDVRFTNLETALAPNHAPVEPRTPDVHRTTPEVLDALKDMGFNMLSLSNNHALDLGAKGLLAAITEVSNRGFAYAGTGPDADAAAAPGFLDTPAGKVALIAMASGASQLANPKTWAAPGQPGVNYLDLRKDGTLNPEQKARILTAVRNAARQAKFVIVYQHSHFWNETTGIAAPPGREIRVNRFDTPAWQIAWAHELIDAGAALYVGHGDPSLHGVEIYKGRPILYSLGNYIFNSEGSLDRYGPLAYYSAVAYCDFTDGKLSAVRFRPLVLSLDSAEGSPRGVPYLAQGGEASAVLERLAQVSMTHGTRITINGDTATVQLPAQGASLRGLHAPNPTALWASGSKGTVLLSTDAGKTWTPRNPPDSESLDFRSVYAFSATRAYILSSGDKEKSKLFRTDDGGLHWTLLYTSHEGFLDGLKFWDFQHGIILGDPLNGSPVILTTRDAGQTWQRRTLPPGDEGAFAASNSSLAVRGTQEAWFGTTAARVFHTKDGGATWTVAQTPIRHDTKSAGIFSLFFQLDGKHGIAVGGEYTKAKEDAHNIALTTDGGRTWTEPAQRPHGYRSAVACIAKTCIATGPEASDQSLDAGRTWTTLDKPGYHALTIAGQVIYASGSEGRLGSLLP